MSEKRFQRLEQVKDASHPKFGRIMELKDAGDPEILEAPRAAAARSLSSKDKPKQHRIKTREEILADMGIAPTAPVAKPIQWKIARPIEPYVYTPPPPKKGGGGFLGFLGDVIDVIDTPRAAIVSTIKETGDLFQGEGFSASDWWKQTSDNMMMGEVLRDWGVDLPGPLHFVVGLGLDIALDPLTYLAAGTLSARFANPNKVADALSSASKTYRAAGKIDEADMLLKAAGNVTSKRSVLSAGDEALSHIGMGVGLRMTVPGTGRIGRTIIEKPLRAISKKAGAALDARRVRQLPEANLPDLLKGPNNPWAKQGKRSYDFSKPGNQKKLVQKINTIRTNKLAPRTAFTDPARQAMRMPVELVRIPIPGNKAFIKLSAGLVGTAFAASASTKFGRSMGNLFGTQGEYNRAIREIGKGMAKGDQNALNMYDYLRVAKGAADTANVRVGTWQHSTLEELRDVHTMADSLGVNYDDLMWRAAEEPWQLVDEAGNSFFNPRLADIGLTESDEVMELHARAQKFWENAGQRLQKELEPFGVRVDLMDFRDEFYVPRFLDEVEAEGVVKGVQADGSRVTINTAIGKSNASGLVGNAFLRSRQYVTPKTMRNNFRADKSDVAGRMGIGPNNADMITDEMVHKAAVAQGLDGAKKGTFKVGMYTPEQLDALFDDLLRSPTGVSFEYANGGKVSNSYLGRQLDDVERAGGVRSQMERIGAEELGADYKKIYSEDFNQAMERYVNQASHRLRENMYMAALDNAGITIRVQDLDGATMWWGQESRRISSQLNGFLNDIGKGLDGADARLAREEPLLDQAAKRKTAYEEATGGEGIDAASARKFDRANEEVTEATRQIAEIKNIIAAINDPNIKNLPEGISVDVFELLRPPTNNPSRGSKIFNKALVDHAGYLDDAEQAVLVVNDMAETINDITQMRISIQQTLDAMTDVSPATKQQFKNLLDELDEAIESGTRGVQELNLNYMDNILKNDPGVTFLNHYDELGEIVTKDTTYKITRNGRKLSSKTFTTPVERELRNFVKRMATAAKNAKDPVVKANILADAKRVEQWLDRVSSAKKLSSQLGEQRIYSGVLNLIKSVDEGVVKIDEIAGINVIQNQIDEVDQLISSSSGINNLDPQSQALRDTLESELRYLEDVNEANKAALIDIQTEWEQKAAYWNDLYQNRKITVEELTARIEALNDARQVMLDRVQLEIIPRGQVTGTLSDRLANLGRVDLEYADVGRQGEIPVGAKFAAGDAQRKAISMIRTARGQHQLFDAYGGALNEYMLKHTSMEFKNGTTGVRRTIGPGGKQTYGRAERAFAGRAVVGEFTDDEMELLLNGMATLGKMQDPQQLGEFWKKYDKFLNWWKAQAVTSPGFFMRNQMGGMWINNQLNDVPMHTHARVRQIRKLAVQEGDGNALVGLERLIAKGKHVDLGGLYGNLISGGTGMRTVSIDELRTFKSWFETGMAGQGQVTMELPTAFAGVRGGAWKQGSLKPWDVDWKPMNWVRARNADSEFMLRGALAHHNMMTGATVEDAWNSVRKFHFDYGDLSMGERRIKKVIPFYVWQRNILPVLVESIGKNPKAWGRLQQVKGELELYSDQEGMVPHWFGENMGIRLPFTRGGNRVYVMPDLPFRDLNKITKDMDSAVDVKGLTEGVFRLGMESALPPVKLPIELMMGKQVFQGIPFSGRYQQAPFWAQIPGVSQALITTGLAKRAKNGRLVMRDNHIYSFDQWSPLIGRMRRLVPNERSKEEAAFTTWMNTMLGTGIRVNTPRMKYSEFIRRQKEFQQTWRDNIDIEMRVR